MGSPAEGGLRDRLSSQIKTLGGYGRLLLDSLSERVSLLSLSQKLGVKSLIEWAI
jgi:hypothetical protein